ncbi:hypothetical protein HaLaN_00248 [Haematococcus lacustris]|uniref:Uncharacterized protein n=1 Tax=Haematococcus lacustris TaxID=44745 RepID=A0A699YD14_HAELA|nr:hypothetical protein HaLaN_00248 [Haematococcus lacustris]
MELPRGASIPTRALEPWHTLGLFDECKVRTSGRDCRFASSGLSRECEPSRDAGYTCSVRFGRFKTSDIAFVSTTGSIPGSPVLSSSHSRNTPL